MNWPNEIDASEIVTTYLVANTPAYLVKHLQRSHEVARIARLGVTDLAQIATQILEQDDRTSSDVGKAYAAIVAMSRHPYRDWKPILEQMDLTRLVWGDFVRQILQAQAVPEHAALIVVPTEQPYLVRAKTTEATAQSALITLTDGQ